MKRWHLISGIAALGVLALGQFGVSQPFQPAVPAPSTITGYGAYPVNTGGATVAGSALNGMASVISAQGDFNLSTSAAAVNMTMAERNAIENRVMATNAYFQMRETNRAAREAERRPRPTEEQLARLARDAAPRPLSSNQMDSLNGQLFWPAALQQDGFAEQRAALEQLSAMSVSHGTLSVSEQMAARRTIEAMFADLRAQIREIPPQDYIASRSFLQGLIYTMARGQL